MRILRPKHEFCAVALAPGNQLINSLLALLQQQFDCRHIAQAVARVERVLQVQADIVFIAQPRGLALGINCGEIRDFLLVKKKNAPAEASSTAARSPATLAPMTIKSVSAGRPFINRENSTTETLERSV